MSDCWWLLFPVAVWAPFNPFSIDFSFKGLLTITVAAAVMIMVVRLPLRGFPTPSFMRPGDIYHLITKVQLRNPVLVRNNNQSESITVTQAPIAGSEGQTASTTLIRPGLAWLLVTTLLFATLFLPLI